MYEDKRAQALGRKGGKKTLELHGLAHFREMALKRWGQRVEQEPEPDTPAEEHP